MNDDARVAAYERAIAATVKPGDVVLDLGAGTGVMGLLACQAGALRVYAIEGGARFPEEFRSSAEADVAVSRVIGSKTR